MLQKLNERIQGVIAWVIILLIASTFTLFGIDYYLQSHQSSDVKVVVNGKVLTNHAFETNYRRARSQQDIAQMTLADEKNLQAEVLNQMISNEVTVQSAQATGFDVSLEQAHAAIRRIPQFQEDGHFSSEKYQQALNNALFTPETFLNEVKQGMLLNQQRFAFMGTSFALPAEVKQFVRLYMQNRDYDYLTISTAALKPQMQVSQPEITKYYKTHQKEFMSAEQVSIEYVTLSMKDIRSQIKVSADDIKGYYDENQSNYLTPAQWKVAHILFAVPSEASADEIAEIQQKAEEAYAKLQQDPKQFEQLLSLSDDKLSIAEKGELPWITAGNKEYDKMLSQLTQVGDISSPQRTQHGFELFKLTAYKPVSTQSLEKVQSTIKDQLMTDMAQAKYAQALEQLTDLSYQTPDSLEPVAEALKLKIQSSAPFSKKETANRLTKNNQVANIAFSHDVLALGNNSEPIQLDNDSVLVLRVKQHFPAKEQPLELVESQIKELLQAEKAKQKAQELGEKLLNPVEDKEQQEIIASKHLKWSSIKQSSRDNDKVNSAINDVAFNLLRPASRNGIQLDNGDYVVVRLQRINQGELSKLDEEQRDSLVQQIEASYGMMDYDLYINHLMNHAKIERH